MGSGTFDAMTNSLTADIYLDHHSTTPMNPAVIDAMLPWMRAPANPHSDHGWGRRASEAVEASLGVIAEVLGARADQVFVTSGATESNNLAIRGFVTHARQKRRQIVTTPTEHPCVLDTTQSLGRDGFDIALVRVDSCGRVDLDHLRDLCTDDTALVSIAAANNEIGVMADLKSIVSIAHECGAVVHSDAAQWVGRVPMSIADLGLDLVTGSAHKFYGPRGSGLLVVGGGGRRIRLQPQIIGGGQQRGLRGGTVDTAAVVGMATALQLFNRRCDATCGDLRKLRDRLWRGLCDGIPGLDDAAINGPPLDSNDRLPGNLNFVLPAVEGEALIAATPSVALSSGSACSSVDPSPSHVLRAIGRDESAARRGVRFGLGVQNDGSQIDAAVMRLVASYHRLTS